MKIKTMEQLELTKKKRDYLLELERNLRFQLSSVLGLINDLNDQIIEYYEVGKHK